jgi:hypothetical protein
VPAPEEQILIQLIDQAADQNEAAASVVKRLMRLRRLKPFGAAIFMDSARYADRRLSAGNVSENDVAFECFYSFFLAQFEGIDDIMGQKLFSLMRLVVGQENVHKLGRALQHVLGIHGLGPQEDEDEPQDEDQER